MRCGEGKEGPKLPLRAFPLGTSRKLYAEATINVDI